MLPQTNEQQTENVIRARVWQRRSTFRRERIRLRDLQSGLRISELHPKLNFQVRVLWTCFNAACPGKSLLYRMIANFIATGAVGERDKCVSIAHPACVWVCVQKRKCSGGISDVINIIVRNYVNDQKL